MTFILHINANGWIVLGFHWLLKECLDLLKRTSQMLLYDAI